MELARKLLIAFLIVLISSYSFNAEQSKDPELAKKYFEKGIESLKVLNYLDALIFFSRAYGVNPKSYYGELSYLYLGKSYALYSYAYGSKKGVLAAIGYLNQYPFHYKVPRFLHTQREFVADSYLLLQWYEKAKNIYANLYGETEKTEYMIKYGYASALGGSIEGYQYLSRLGKEGVPEDYLDLYYMTMGFYNFNLGKYDLSAQYMSHAINTNTYLREDPHLLFRLGVSYYKLGDWRRALLYLELALRKDTLKIYGDKANYYLARINLETKNYREAYANIERLTRDGGLFYRKHAQLLFSSLWYYDDFIEVYGNRLGNYRDKLLQLGWLNVENVFGELPAIGIYYLSLKERSLSEEERDFLRVKRLSLREFVFENDLFTFDMYVEKLRSYLKGLSFYRKKDVTLLSELYKTSRDNFFTLFGTQEGVELLARSLLFLGDDEAGNLVTRIAKNGIRKLLLGKLYLLKGDRKKALKLLRESLPGLEGDDLLEAKLLHAYLSENPEELEKAIAEIDFRKDRFAPYEPVMLLKTADLYYEKGNLEKALTFYRRVVSMGEGEEGYWWAMFRTALISERLEDKRTLKWVVKRAKEKDNIWSRVIRTLWEG